MRDYVAATLGHGGDLVADTAEAFRDVRDKRTLRLAKLHGPGLAWFGISAAQVATDIDSVDPALAYAMTQHISAIVHHETALDGIQYRSRFDSNELCIALFDGADGAMALESDGLPLEREWWPAAGLVDTKIRCLSNWRT